MVAGVILAAGYSARMGRPKALLPMGQGGRTFIDQLIDTLRRAGLETIVVVAGADADRILDAMASTTPPVRIVQNSDPSKGQLSSLLVALAALGGVAVEAALVMPVDQPLVSADTVRLVLEAYRRSGAPIVRPAGPSRHGHPVIFDRSLFEELGRADLAYGARGVIEAHRDAVVDVRVDDEGAFVDIDTPEDYRRAFGRPPA
jgi:molybdenum cofactor cytidylyltransferase